MAKAEIELPEALQFELAVLGSVIIDKLAIDRVVDILSPECFYDTKNAIIYRAILEMYQDSIPIDLLTLSKYLTQKGLLQTVGGAYFLSQLTNAIASSANIEFHARIIVQQFLKREMIRLSKENINNAFEDRVDVFDLYGKGIQRLESAISGVIKYDVSAIGKVHSKVLKLSREIVNSGQKSGVPTGFYNLDNFTNGWQKTDLVIVAGRPAMGKSVCALAFVLNPAIKDNIPTAIFSLEMSNEQLVGRAQSNLSEIDSSRIIKKQLTLEEIDIIERRCSELATAPIYIDDTPSLSLLELKGKSRKLVREKGVKLIVIDYLQLMTVDVNRNGSRELEVSTISRGLKALAKELDVPIIALSQLNRAVEARADKKPLLSDLRESGSIEQDADMVIFCFRPEYYGINSYEMGSETMASEGLMVLIVAKHRAGQLGELRLGFNGNLTKLQTYEAYKESTTPFQNPFSNSITPNPNAVNPPTGRITPSEEELNEDEYEEEIPF